MKNEIINYNETIFENIKHIDDEGVEFWYARELMKVLDYKKWQKFLSTIERAKNACKASNYNVIDQFTQVGKLVDIGSKTRRKISDYKLTRYACYLIVQNCDPRKKAVALGQTYFAIQTRKQEILEEYEHLSEDEKRLKIRKQTKKENYTLNRTAVNAGVKNLDKFHNAGYKGLYNGETADDIAKRKELRYREDMLDNMGSEELADNLFRIVQTNSKLKKDNIIGETKSCETHYEVGKKIRDTINELGGTMPEDLPTPNKSIKELETKYKLKNSD